MAKKLNRETPPRQAGDADHRSSFDDAALASFAPTGEPVTDFHGYTREILVSRFADIMAAIAQKSSEGSLSHIKYLFDLGGIREAIQSKTQSDGQPTLAELLLGEVKKRRDLYSSVESAEANATPREAAVKTIPLLGNGGAEAQ